MDKQNGFNTGNINGSNVYSTAFTALFGDQRQILVK